MRANMFDVKRAADHWLEGVIHKITFRDVQLCITKVANARREAEAKLVHQGKDMIAKACRIGVVLLDPYVGLMVYSKLAVFIVYGTPVAAM